MTSSLRWKVELGGEYKSWGNRASRKLACKQESNFSIYKATFFSFKTLLFSPNMHRKGSQYTTDYRTPGQGPPPPPRKRFGGFGSVGTAPSCPGGGCGG
uniref:Uncharacterized protein n=1 Tax=Timema genevievae TaxID=629358 RepID=A0A7R9PIF4_TIMGE|nr:unnamed protein product [Timema genevievae]